jgi:hypothetical protein
VTSAVPYQITELRRTGSAIRSRVRFESGIELRSTLTGTLLAFEPAGQFAGARFAPDSASATAIRYMHEHRAAFIDALLAAIGDEEP